jgi:transposase
MDVAPLFADPKFLRLERVPSEPDGITLIVKTAPKARLCPQCHQPSTHFHTHSQDNSAETIMMAFLSVA